MGKIKLSLIDFKKALGWIEGNTHENYLNLAIDGEVLRISCTDKYQTVVEIELYSDKANMLPKIKKTSLLGDK